MEHNPSSSGNPNAKVERNIKERERRLKMKNLYTKLASVIQPQPRKASVPDLIDQATSYVNQLHGRLESLKQQKEFYGSSFNDCTDATRPLLNVQSWDSSVMEVNLICRSDKKALVFECFRIIQEEGAEVMNFISHNVGETTIFIIKAQAMILRIGMDTSRIEERLKDLIR